MRVCVFVLGEIATLTLMWNHDMKYLALLRLV